jgi:hypothetical protein
MREKQFGPDDRTPYLPATQMFGARNIAAVWSRYTHVMMYVLIRDRLHTVTGLSCAVDRATAAAVENCENAFRTSARTTVPVTDVVRPSPSAANRMEPTAGKPYPGHPQRRVKYVG